MSNCPFVGSMLLIHHTYPVDKSIASFLERNHLRRSDTTTVALECVTGLSMTFVRMTVAVAFSVQQQRSMTNFSLSSLSSSLHTWSALKRTRFDFFRKATESPDNATIMDVYIDHMEAAASSLYKQISLYTPSKASRRIPPAVTKVFSYQLSQHACTFHGTRAESCLVRRLCSTEPLNEGVEARWNAQMALHFRACCRVIDKFLYQVKVELPDGSPVNPKYPHTVPKISMLDDADQLEGLFCSLRRTKPLVGTEIDLRGRTVFQMEPGVNSVYDSNESIVQNGNPVRPEVEATGNKSAFTSRSGSKLLVVDPMELFIVRANQSNKRTETFVSRGTILCCIPLLHIIAVGVDGEWLHVAVRHENFRSLIKNGNMVLQFDSHETCSSVRNYLETQRRERRMAVSERIQKILACSDSEEVVQETGLSDLSLEANGSSRNAVETNEEKKDEEER